ncbi:hydrolase, alpha/beta fold family protein [Roseobacter sp. SK209-2-6]|uniref:alpha/beta fold hydrolase n=1 Tax=Roseobacter sp. SK209-2-6 TaxID=388739 RepID=UPI0000F3F32C|nr:alpha/beta hydrolase [Roseobacter sp. SK209-2-6]EBA16405.1 hydrolase, alpha/beta fold family protein [Roseobacter sp. SK209-2-6]
MSTVVFVHGFLGGSRQWRAQVEAFSGFKVVTLDLPGFGDNAQLPALDSIAEYAVWALDVLSARGIEQFGLLGHSMGGMIVQEMVKRAPERIEQLVLYGTGATGILPGRFETIDTSKRRAKVDGPGATARRIAATWFLDREHAEAYEECAEIAEQCSLGAIQTGLQAMQGWSGFKNLEAIKSRTLVIWGDHDRTYPWCQTEQLWQSIKGANLSVIPGCAHAVHLEKPVLFNNTLLDFFAS